MSKPRASLVVNHVAEPDEKPAALDSKSWSRWEIAQHLEEIAKMLRQGYIAGNLGDVEFDLATDLHDVQEIQEAENENHGQSQIS